MQPYNAGLLSLVPPVITILLAIRTKEIISSLLAGILVGSLIYSIGIGNSPVILKTVEVSLALIVQKVDFNIIVFGSLLGALVYLVAMTGGTQAYADWTTKRIKTKRSALLATSFLGFAMFIDDYFNCLSIGTVMQPVTDKFKVSRAKLAYIIDATAAPVCIIAPISSWAVGVGSNIKSTGISESSFSAFISTIPWNFYAIFTLLIVLMVSWGGFDFGPMLRAEDNSQINFIENKESKTDNEYSGDSVIEGKLLYMLLPIGSLILFSVLGLLYTGGYWGSDPSRHSLVVAFGNCDAAKALMMASFGAIVVAYLIFVPSKVLPLQSFMGGAVEGIKVMLPCVIVLVLAWAMGGLCRDLLQTPKFITELIGTSPKIIFLLPAIFFIFAGFLSFCTGTSWGTFGILIPIAVPVVQSLDPSLVIACLAAVLAGSVFGDHSSPISDTSILSSGNAGCPLIEHISTQMPYACVAFVGSLVGYLVAGITNGNLIMSFLSGLIVTVGSMFILRNRSCVFFIRKDIKAR